MRAYLDGIHKDCRPARRRRSCWRRSGRRCWRWRRGAARRGALQRDARAYGAGGRRSSGPGKWLAVEQKVCVETDPARARALGRKELARYMALPNYVNNWLRLGFSRGRARRWRQRPLHRRHGAVGRRRRRSRQGLRAHFAAGATHVCIQPVTTTATSPRATPCWRRWPIPEGAGPMLKLGYKASAEQFAPAKLLDFACLRGAGRVRFRLRQRSLPALEAYRRPRAVLARLAGRARRAHLARIVMGTSVLTPTFRYHPSIVAQAFGTLGVDVPGPRHPGRRHRRVAERGAVDRHAMAGVQGAVRPPARGDRP